MASPARKGPNTDAAGSPLRKQRTSLANGPYDKASLPMVWAPTGDAWHDSDRDPWSDGKQVMASNLKRKSDQDGDEVDSPVNQAGSSSARPMGETAVPLDHDLDDERTFNDLHPDLNQELQRILVCEASLTAASANLAQIFCRTVLLCKEVKGNRDYKLGDTLRDQAEEALLANVRQCRSQNLKWSMLYDWKKQVAPELASTCTKWIELSHFKEAPEHWKLYSEGCRQEPVFTVEDYSAEIPNLDKALKGYDMKDGSKKKVQVVPSSPTRESITVCVPTALEEFAKCCSNKSRGKEKRAFS